MEQFVAVAAAHLLALLIPGVDFLLIARTSMTYGTRRAIAVCLGIAAANGLFIAAAFMGISLITNPTVLTMVQVAGGAFLVWVGVAFLRSQAGTGELSNAEPTSASTGRWKSIGLGLASGLLNPKNALFYVSLAAVVTATEPAALIGYGIWMFSVVLIWDILVAMLFGSRRAMGRMGRAVPWLTRFSGAFLMVFGIVMVVKPLVGW